MAMRKLLFIVTIAWVICAFASSPASASVRQFEITGVIGTGTLGQLGDPTVRVDAIQTAERPAGGFLISYPDGTFAFGSATCLFVSGNTAYLTSQIIGSFGPRRQANGWFPRSYIIIGVQGSSQPGSAGSELLNFSSGFAANPGCGPNAAATPVFPVTRGSFRVFGGS
jgi:hypothetical protein